MRYAYQVSSDIALYPQLGSLVRAIGKGWQVQVLAPLSQQKVWKELQSRLTNQDGLIINSLEEFEKKRYIKPDLIISMYSEESVDGNHVMSVEQNPEFEQFDLISRFEETKLNSTGVTAVTGNGKGKTTTALGIAAEALASGKKVAVVQWFKEKKSGDLTWAINEHQFPNFLTHSGLFTFYPTGAGFVGSPNMDRVSEEKEHRKKAEEGVQIALRLMESNDYAVIVLDEFVDTLPQVMQHLPYPLLSIGKVCDVLKIAALSSTKVVVTGRKVTQEWQRFIKNSITITEIKHPWRSRKAGAVPGLDY